MEIVDDHLIPRSKGGSWHPCNLRPSDRREEQNKHRHHGVMLPHEKWEHDADWDSTCLIREVKEELSKLIDKFGKDMYVKEAVRDWRAIDESFHKRNGIYVPR